jgi:hypothetical protein
MSPHPLRCILFALILPVLLSGCAGFPPTKPFFPRTFSLPFFKEPTGPVAAQDLEVPPANHPENYWRENVKSGEPLIVVKLGVQRAYFYRGRHLVGASRISSGKKGYTTPPGSYRVTQKDEHHVSTLYGDFVDESGTVVKSNVAAGKDEVPAGASFRGAKMPYYLRFTGGYGLHAGRVPNFPASHGCVRLPADMAKKFFQAAEIGTPVRVEE